MRFPVYLSVSGSADHDTAWRRAGAWVLDIRQKVYENYHKGDVRVVVMRERDGRDSRAVTLRCWSYHSYTPEMDVADCALRRLDELLAKPTRGELKPEIARLRRLLAVIQAARYWRAKSAARKSFVMLEG